MFCRGCDGPTVDVCLETWGLEGLEPRSWSSDSGSEFMVMLKRLALTVFLQPMILCYPLC